MIPEVDIYIEYNTKGPRRIKEGRYMYVLRYAALSGKVAERIQGDIISDSTENELALTGLAEAMSRITTKCQLRLHCENQHIKNVLVNCWHAQWAKNDWHKANGGKVANADLWDRLYSLMRDHVCTLCDGNHEYRRWMLAELSSDDFSKRWGKNGKK